MIPFHSDPLFQGWSRQLPRPEEVAKLDKLWAIEKFVRLWLTEGTPYAFIRCPEIYEDLRRWLANRLNACPKDITVLGSARLGYSLKPEPNYGRPFGEKSDLDLALVSASTFEDFRKMFFNWEYDYDNGFVKPRNQKERGYWDENKIFGRMNLPRGFFDSNKLPNFDRYPVAQRVNHSLWCLKEKLKITPRAPEFKNASVRIYRDWKSLVCIVSYNLKWALSKFSPQMKCGRQIDRAP